MRRAFAPEREILPSSKSARAALQPSAAHLKCAPLLGFAALLAGQSSSMQALGHLQRTAAWVRPAA